MKAGKASISKYLVLLAHIGALLTASAWGTSFLSTKILMESGGFTPVEMYVYRFLAAYLILLLFTFRNILSKSWRDELTFLLCGVCAGSLYFITENYALRLTTAQCVIACIHLPDIHHYTCGCHVPSEDTAGCYDRLNSVIRRRRVYHF